MKLKGTLKRMLDALAYADAAELLTTQQKLNLLAGTPTPPAGVTVPATMTEPTTARPQVGLYVGSELPEEMMQYAIQTCSRLRHGLTVLTLQSEPEAKAILRSYHTALEAAGVDVRLVLLKGEPVASLAYALHHSPEVAFLVCNESGYLGSGLLTGRVRGDIFPVPVVMVTGNEAKLADRDASNEISRTA